MCDILPIVVIIHWSLLTLSWTHLTTWWRHQMETFSALLAICAGNSPVNSPHKGQWRGAMMFTLICARINGWVNNREAGDLRRYHTHYDVIVIQIPHCNRHCYINNYSDITWVLWRLNSPVCRLFVQKFVQANDTHAKSNLHIAIPPVTSGLPSQRAIKAVNVFMSYRQHVW